MLLGSRVHTAANALQYLNINEQMSNEQPKSVNFFPKKLSSRDTIHINALYAIC